MGLFSKLRNAINVNANDKWGVAFIELLHNDVQMPERATAGSAGYDLRAYLNNRDIKIYTPTNVLEEVRAEGSIVIPPWSRALIPLGFKATLPPGTEGQIRPRSGLSLKKGLLVANSPGTLDSDYSGEVGVILWNTTETSAKIEHGERIAQLVIGWHQTPLWFKGVVSQTTERSGGFGHTGTK